MCRVSVPSYIFTFPRQRPASVRPTALSRIVPRFIIHLPASRIVSSQSYGSEAVARAYDLSTHVRLSAQEAFKHG